MATINLRGSGNQSFKQIEGDTWSSIYLPAICACILMTIVLFLAVSCSKKSDNAARISAPSAQAATTPAAPVAAMPETPKKTAKKRRPANATYVNGTYGLSFSYPRKYSLQAGNKKNNAPVQNSFLKSGAVQVAAVDMPGDSYPDTDFSAALLNVSVQPNLTPEECSQFVPASNDGDPVKPTIVKLGSNEFSELEQMTGVEGNQSDLKYFHLFKNGACYEFVLDVETSRKADEELAQLDRGKVFQQLEKILTTAKIKDVEVPGVVNAQKSIEAPAATAESKPIDDKTEKAQVVTPVEQK